ncbi:MAG TPA: hypothetical protein VKX45_20095 [Bryobacteraceae bacterium]|nr:hypothetical protein [Bryobacteraceae bacterium]
MVLLFAASVGVALAQPPWQLDYSQAFVCQQHGLPHTCDAHDIFWAQNGTASAAKSGNCIYAIPGTNPPNKFLYVDDSIHAVNCTPNGVVLEAWTETDIEFSTSNQGFAVWVQGTLPDGTVLLTGYYLKLCSNEQDGEGGFAPCDGGDVE